MIKHSQAHSEVRALSDAEIDNVAGGAFFFVVAVVAAPLVFAAAMHAVARATS